MEINCHIEFEGMNESQNELLSATYAYGISIIFIYI